MIARQWIIIGLTYYCCRAMFIIFPESDKSTTFQMAIEIIQALMCVGMCLTVFHSYKSDFLDSIKLLLFVQAIQMVLSNFSVYKRVNTLG